MANLVVPMHSLPIKEQQVYEEGTVQNHLAHLIDNSFLRDLARAEQASHESDLAMADEENIEFQKLDGKNLSSDFIDSQELLRDGGRKEMERELVYRRLQTILEEGNSRPSDQLAGERQITKDQNKSFTGQRAQEKILEKLLLENKKKEAFGLQKTLQISHGKEKNNKNPENISFQQELEQSMPLYRTMATQKKNAIKQFQNQFQNESILRPVVLNQNNEERDTSLVHQVANNARSVVAAKNFLEGLQSQMIGHLGQVSDTQLLSMERLGNIPNSDIGQLVEKISNYINQRLVGNAREIDLSVNHHEIGKFKISVSQNIGEQGVQLVITTFAKEGADFFGLNQGGLLSSLGQKGIHVQDFKLEQQFNDRSDRQHASNDDSRREGYQEHQDSSRRRELWEQFERG